MRRLAICGFWSLILGGVVLTRHNRLHSFIAAQVTLEDPHQVVVAQVTEPEIPFIHLTAEQLHEQTSHISAPVFLVYDRQSGKILLEQNKDQLIYPASTIKLITALVALDVYDLQEILTVPDTLPSGTNIGLQPGQKLTVEDLLYATLLASANDAAHTLLHGAISGSDAFMSSLRELSEQVGIKSEIQNVTGLDNQLQQLSGLELLHLADVALEHTFISNAVSNESQIIAIQMKNSAWIEVQVENTNKLLSDERIAGVKTGTTEQAGQILISRFVPLVSDQQRDLLILVAGSTDRYKDTRALLNVLDQHLAYASVGTELVYSH